MFIAYSGIIYTDATESDHRLPEKEVQLAIKGKTLYQQYNCQSCHQIYGLGGYLGPDLTHAWSDTGRGEPVIRAMLSSGGARMPDFQFNQQQIESLTAYMNYLVGTTAKE